MKPQSRAITKALIAVLALFVVIGAALALWLRSDARAGSQVTVLVEAPVDIYSLNFNRLWGLVAGKAEVDPNGASLEQFRLLYRPSGEIQSFHVQVLTADGYLIEIVGAESTKVSVYGSRSPDGPPPHSSWSTSLDQTFGVLDRVGLRAFEQPIKEQIAAARDLFGFDLSIDMRENGGHGAVGGVERAFFLEDGSFVRLGPNDPRREFGPTDVALGFALSHKTSNGSASLAADGDFTYFIVPAS